jgi:hypothetical protein
VKKLQIALFLKQKGNGYFIDHLKVLAATNQDMFEAVKKYAGFGRVDKLKTNDGYPDAFVYMLIGGEWHCFTEDIETGVIWYGKQQRGKQAAWKMIIGFQPLPLIQSADLAGKSIEDGTTDVQGWKECTGGE